MVRIPTEHQLDTLKEIVNIGVGQSASSLNQMLDSLIELQVPSIYLLSPNDSAKDIIGLGDKKLASVKLSFSGSFTGSASLVFPNESAEKLISILTKEKPGTSGFNSVMAGTLNEVGNIVMNGVIGSISNVMSTPLDFALPNYSEGTLTDILGSNNEDDSDIVMLLVKTNFTVQNLEINGHIFLIFEVGSFDGLLLAIDNLYS